MEYTILTITTQNHIQMLDLSCTLVMKNDVIWYNESHSLLLTYLKPLLECLCKKEDVYKDIYQPLWCHSGPYNHQVSLPKYQENNRFGG